MTSDMLSQEEIDALLTGDSDEGHTENDFLEEDDFEEENQEDENVISQDNEELQELLSDIEKDALGEIGNISMGTAATTLSTLLDKKVNITTPTVNITTSDQLSEEYKTPFVAIDVSYKEGLEGSNILILHTDDVKVITDLMMGKEEVDRTRDLTDLDLSAVGEAMNQMMGSASTSLSEMLSKKIDIEPPKSMEITFSEGKKEIDLLKGTDPIIQISFRMEIGEFIDSNIMQLVPIHFGKDMVEQLMGTSKSEELVNRVKDKPVYEQEPIREQQRPVQQETFVDNSPRVDRTENMNYNNESRQVQTETVVIQKPTFQSFDETSSSTGNAPIDMVGDIPVEITVELGRTNKKIGEILEFGVGTVVELDKLVGEPLNIYANGKYIAKGEVVVIDDSFGVRVTDIDNNHSKII